MILALSRFTVKHGKEGDVRAAFEGRPRLVEGTLGFLGLEVFQQGATFLLLTRWVDEPSFRAWHEGPAHHEAHGLMPPGLKLDPAGTQLVVAERIGQAGTGAREGELVVDHVIPIAELLRQATSVHIAVLDERGRILHANAAFADAIGVAPDELAREPVLLDDRLVAGSRNALRALYTGAISSPITLQIVQPGGDRVSLRAFVQRLPEGMVIVAEPPSDDQRRLEEQLRASNAELAVLSRENARQARLLAQAHRELRDAHWHLKKLSDVLPICMACHAVKTSENTWEDTATFLARDGDFLSHGYCPRCADDMARSMKEER